VEITQSSIKPSDEPGRGVDYDLQAVLYSNTGLKVPTPIRNIILITERERESQDKSIIFV
jgi:hypothetical protein